MEYEHFEVHESTYYGDKNPHYFSVRVSFKSKADREKFKKIIEDALNA